MFFSKYLKCSVVVLLVICSNNISSKGFIKGTLVKTKDSYKPIEQLNKNDEVLAYNFKSKELALSKISRVSKSYYKKCIKLTINGKEVLCALDHKFFCPLIKGCWIKAKDLNKDDFILSDISRIIRIDNIEHINCDSDFYCLSMKDNHNYLVTDNDILVHNEVFVLGTIGAFVVTFEVGLPLVCGLVVWLGRNICGANHPNNETIALSTSGMILYKKMTNKQAHEDAEELGFTENKGIKSKKGDGPVFSDEKGKMHITPDLDGHGKSKWKQVNKKGDRIASLDENLKVIRK